MGLFSSIKKIYTQVDKKVGGVLPGGSPSILKGTVTTKELPAVQVYPKTSTPSPTPSAPTPAPSGGGGAKPTIPGINRGTYNPSTGVYIDPSGVGSSRATPPPGAIITLVPSPQEIAVTRRRTSGGGVSRPYAQSTQSSYYGIVEPYQRATGGAVSERVGLGSLSEKINQARRTLRTEKYRSRTGNIKATKEAKLLGLTFLSSVVDFGKGVVDLPEMAYRIATKPKILLDVAKNFDRSAKNFGELARVSPGEAFVKVGSEILLMKGAGKVFEKVGDVTKSQITKLNPKYVGKAEIGTTLKVPTKGGDVVNLKVVGKIPRETIAKQVARGGTTVRTGISSQADNLLTLIKRQRVIRKPIAGESSFTKETKNLLKKFDKGTIKRTQIIKLDKLIKKQGAKGLLERSFFIDPTGKVRPSRLGIIKPGKGKFLDYFTEDITFRKPKPQILLFRKIKVQAFPRNLKSVANKLKRGVPLTRSEANKLLEFQLKQSGKAKPVGFISGESEISLAPGEIIKKVKKVGVTVINNKRVPIIQTEIYRPTGKIKSLITKYKSGKLSKGQIKKLDKVLERKTGFKYNLSSYPKKGARYVSPKRLGLSALSRYGRSKVRPTYGKSSMRKVYRDSSGKFVSKGSSRATSSKTYSYSRPTSYTSRSPAYSPPRRPPYSPPRKSYYSPPRRPPYSPPRGPPRSPPKTPPRLLKLYSKKRGFRRTTKGRVGFAIYEKRGLKGRKFYKLKSAPLSRKQALDRLTYRLDNKISRTAKIVSIGKVRKLGKISRKELNYFTRYRNKFRPYRIKRGKRIPLSQAYIEKRRYVLDRPGERRQLSLNKALRSRPTIRRTGIFRGHSARVQRRDSHGRFIKRKR